MTQLVSRRVLCLAAMVTWVSQLGAVERKSGGAIEASSSGERIFRVGFLGFRSEETSKSVVAAFQRGLMDERLISGVDFHVEYRFAGGDRGKLRRDAGELVALGVDVLIGGGVIPTLAAMGATDDIPIVFFSGADPISAGLVKSYSRPTGNMTGVAYSAHDVGSKLLELINELAPASSTIGAIFHASEVNARNESDLNEAARSLNRQIYLTRASNEHEVRTAFLQIARNSCTAVVVGPGAFFADRAQVFIELSMQYKLPAIYSQRSFVDAGGLMSYGPSVEAGYRWVGAYTGRLLRGERIADLPIVRTDSYELILNLRTARALDLDIPQSLIALAAEVLD